MAHSPSGILFSVKKEKTVDTFNNIIDFKYILPTGSNQTQKAIFI